MLGLVPATEVAEPAQLGAALEWLLHEVVRRPPFHPDGMLPRGYAWPSIVVVAVGAGQSPRVHGALRAPQAREES